MAISKAKATTPAKTAAKPQAKAPVKAAAKAPAKAACKKPLTKTELVSELATTTGLPKKEVMAFLDTVVAIAYREVKKVGEFALPGIGKLVKQKRLARIGRNPKTGEKIKIAAKTVVKMRVSKTAKDAVL